MFDLETTHVGKGEQYEFISKKGVKKSQPKWFADAFLKSTNRETLGKERSKTFPGIAKAMAKQWSEYVSETINK